MTETRFEKQSQSNAGQRFCLCILLVALILAPTVLTAQARIIINEVIAENADVPPEDLEESTPDMIEILFDSTANETVDLGSADPTQSYYLSDRQEFDEMRAWPFPEGERITAGTRLVIFCDAKDQSLSINDCELHASFSIAGNGSEPVSLWGPEDTDGERPLLDQVWLPPLRNNTSFGRPPGDDKGPAPVPIAEVMNTFNFYRLGAGSEAEPSFGSCVAVGQGTCQVGDRTVPNRFCSGARNGSSSANLEPLVSRFFESTNSPSPLEPVAFTAKVRDDKDPLPENITRVEIMYRVDGGSWESIEMRPDGNGVQTNAVVFGDLVLKGQPLDRFAVYEGSIPGQPSLSRVEFYFQVTDAEGLTTTDPQNLCADGVGPCDREFGGPNCVKDAEDVTCVETDEGGMVISELVGERYVSCSAYRTYASGYEPRGDLSSVVINEVIARQKGLLEDPTDTEQCTIMECGLIDIACCRKTEDFIELHNSGNTTVDLTGLWLSNRRYDPQRWQFPAESKILAGEYLTVWLDSDGGKCPDNSNPDKPCFWECPDPTDPSVQYYHTNFDLNFNNDQVFLFDSQENAFGLVHGVEFDFDDLLDEFFPDPNPDDDIDPNDGKNFSLALNPDGDRTGCYHVTDEPSPELPNPEVSGRQCVRFLRGDSNADGGINLADASFTLNWVFLGGTTPPCLVAADANADGRINLADGPFTLEFFFRGGAQPRPPWPSCGTFMRETDLAITDGVNGPCETPHDCVAAP